jgi:hypothetical protein
VGGTLRGAGDEKVGRCFEGVLVECVGVAIVAGGSDADKGTWIARCFHLIQAAIEVNLARACCAVG